MNELKLICTGDIFLQTKNGLNPFQNIKEVFFGDVLLFGNLESALSNKGKPIEKRVLIKMNPSKVDHLTNAGFDIVNIANNHIMDYGKIGLRDTIDILDKKNIKFIGAGKNINDAVNPVIFQRNGFKIGFIGFTEIGIMATENRDGCAPLNKELLLTLLPKLRKEVDILIISLHWGVEYVFYPSPNQQKIARFLIDNGADLVIGHHPHVIQGIEKYKNKFIFYSLGNCNFGTEQDKNYNGTNVGVILSIKFSKKIIKEKRI